MADNCDSAIYNAEQYCETPPPPGEEPPYSIARACNSFAYNATNNISVVMPMPPQTDVPIPSQSAPYYGSTYSASSDSNNISICPTSSKIDETVAPPSFHSSDTSRSFMPLPSNNISINCSLPPVSDKLVPLPSLVSNSGASGFSSSNNISVLQSTSNGPVFQTQPFNNSDSVPYASPNILLLPSTSKDMDCSSSSSHPVSSEAPLFHQTNISVPSPLLSSNSDRSAMSSGNTLDLPIESGAIKVVPTLAAESNIQVLCPPKFDMSVSPEVECDYTVPPPSFRADTSLLSGESSLAHSTHPVDYDSSIPPPLPVPLSLPPPSIIDFSVPPPMHLETPIIPAPMLVNEPETSNSINVPPADCADLSCPPPSTLGIDRLPCEGPKMCSSVQGYEQGHFQNLNSGSDVSQIDETSNEIDNEISAVASYLRAVRNESSGSFVAYDCRNRDRGSIRRRRSSCTSPRESSVTCYSSENFQKKMKWDYEQSSSSSKFRVQAATKYENDINLPRKGHHQLSKDSANKGHVEGHSRNLNSQSTLKDFHQSQSTCTMPSQRKTHYQNLSQDKYKTSRNLKKKSIKVLANRPRFSNYIKPDLIKPPLNGVYNSEKDSLLAEIKSESSQCDTVQRSNIDYDYKQRRKKNHSSYAVAQDDLTRNISPAKQRFNSQISERLQEQEFVRCRPSNVRGYKRSESPCVDGRRKSRSPCVVGYRKSRSPCVDGRRKSRSPCVVGYRKSRSPCVDGYKRSRSPVKRNKKSRTALADEYSLISDDKNGMARGNGHQSRILSANVCGRNERSCVSEDRRSQIPRKESNQSLGKDGRNRTCSAKIKGDRKTRVDELHSNNRKCLASSLSDSKSSEGLKQERNKVHSDFTSRNDKITRKDTQSRKVCVENDSKRINSPSLRSASSLSKDEASHIESNLRMKTEDKSDEGTDNEDISSWVRSSPADPYYRRNFR